MALKLTCARDKIMLNASSEWFIDGEVLGLIRLAPSQNDISFVRSLHF